MTRYLGIHLYTVMQIFITAVIFVVTLTKGAPAFPIIIIILVPVRLLLLNKMWNRETLRYVDTWACRDGGPEDEDLIVDTRGHPLQRTCEAAA